MGANGKPSIDVAIRLADPIAPQIVTALKRAIADLRLRPGEALSEQEIAGRFGVSRQPVREAFIKLADAGLLEIRPSRGTYVQRISVSGVANARFVREAVECSIAQNAARLATDVQIAGLTDLIEAQKKAAVAGDRWLFNDLDEAFHHAIARVVQCDFAWRTVEAARIQTDRVRHLSLADASPMPLLIRQHGTIVERIAGRDPDGAEAAMRRHLREILIALPRVAAAHPDLFADTALPEHTIGLVPTD